MKYFTFIIFSIFLYACNAPKETSNNSVKTIDITLDKLNEPINQSDLIDSLWTVQLETTKDNLVSNCLRVIYNDGYLYLFNYSRSIVFIFDESGKFINKIDAKGKGPREYIMPEEMSVNSRGEVMLFDPPNKAYFYFSKTGDFLRREKLFDEFVFWDMKELPNGGYFYYTDKRNNTGKDFYEYHGFFYNKDEEIVPVLPNKQEIDNHIVSFDENILSNSTSIFFHVMLRNFIYKINDDNTLTKAFHIDLKDKSLPDKAFVRGSGKFEKKLEYDKKLLEGYYYIIGGIKVTDNHLIVPIYDDQFKLVGTTWTSLKTGKTLVGSSIISSTGESISNFARCTNGNTIICIEDDVDRIYRNTETSFDMEKNPVVTFYRLKNF